VPAIYPGGIMTTEALQSRPGAAIRRIVELTSDLKVLRNNSVVVSADSKIHIWQLSNQTVLVITEVGKRMTGVDVRKGSYDAIFAHFESKYSQDTVTVH
jgi:hypothetical protein